MKVFIPCINGRCPERMQLVTRDRDRHILREPYYKCMGEWCLYHDAEYAREHCRAGLDINTDRWADRVTGEPTKENLETMI